MKVRGMIIGIILLSAVVLSIPFHGCGGKATGADGMVIAEFEWDEYNLGHLQSAHPHISPDLLEDVVREAKRYRQLGKDRYGKTVYAARRGKLTVLFNIKLNRIVRIFSVRER